MIKNCYGDFSDSFSCCERGGGGVNRGGGGGWSELEQPMEFIQVLIHQHAKTLVALNTLKTQVNSLTNSNSIPTQNNNTQKTDSGFHANQDSLLSLLSQIEQKVNNLKPKKKQKLGYLDDTFSNSNFDFTKFQKIDKKLIKEVLSCEDLDELRRQLLFCGARMTEKSEDELKKENEELRKRVSLLEGNNNKNFTEKKSLGSYRSLIPVPIRPVIVRNKNFVKGKKFVWGQWFG